MKMIIDQWIKRGQETSDPKGVLLPTGVSGAFSSTVREEYLKEGDKTKGKCQWKRILIDWGVICSF